MLMFENALFSFNHDIYKIFKVHDIIYLLG